MKYVEPLFRPPAEAESLIFQVAFGCPHNRCRFCGMYKGVRHRLRPGPELLQEIAEAGRRCPGAVPFFLADGDVMALPFERLRRILLAIRSAFPAAARVGLYANGSSILARSAGELAELRALGLHTFYLGLESGSQPLLDLFEKEESVDGMVEAVRRAREAGLHASVMILHGLAPAGMRAGHVEGTAAALNRMQPNLLSSLRFIPVPGLPLPDGYRPPSEYEAAEELRSILARLELGRTVFRADHVSNSIPLAGRFPNDRERLVRRLDALLASGTLERSGPGRLPLSP